MSITTQTSALATIPTGRAIAADKVGAAAAPVAASGRAALTLASSGTARVDESDETLLALFLLEAA